MKTIHRLGRRVRLIGSDRTGRVVGTYSTPWPGCVGVLWDDATEIGPPDLIAADELEVLR